MGKNLVRQGPITPSVAALTRSSGRAYNKVWGRVLGRDAIDQALARLQPGPRLGVLLEPEGIVEAALLFTQYKSANLLRGPRYRVFRRVMENGPIAYR